jgi:FkbM family methyltransferase
MSLKSTIRRIPFVLPVWRSLTGIPAVVRFREALQLKRMYGQFAPESLVLKNTGATMFLDPHEKRGRAVLRCRAGGQPALKAIWGRMVRELNPTLVLDVGLNYGEFVLNERYAEGAAIIGIEANPALMPWLERSRATHPNAAQMRFLHALADAETAASGKFYVNPKWSGTSSALAGSEAAGFQSCDVPVVAIDDLVAERALEQERLAFKIDVEGFEPRVMAGMTKLLQRCPSWLGLIEFNGATFERLGVTAESILAGLLSQAKICAIEHDGKSREITSADWQTFFPGKSINELSVDLLLISHGADVPAESLLECNTLSS